MYKKLILLENKYPITVLNASYYLGKRFTSVLNNNVKGKPVYMVLPYGGKMSEEIKTNLMILVKKYFPHIDFNFFSFKD